MSRDAAIRFDGLSEDEILAMPSKTMEALFLTGRPVVFQVGSATLLGESRQADGHLIVELAQIEGGGEGILNARGSLVKRYATQRGLRRVRCLVRDA